MPIHLVLAGIEPGRFERLEQLVIEGGGQILSWHGSEDLASSLQARSMSPDETIALIPSSSRVDQVLRSARLALASIGTGSPEALEHLWNDEAAACRWWEGALQLQRRAWPIATVGGLAFRDDGKALFVRTAKWSGTWGVPGGKIDFGEGYLEAFVREMREETGLDVEDSRLVLVQDAIGEPEFHRHRHFLLLNLVCRVTGYPVPRLNHESLESGWYSLEEALSLGLNRPTRALVEHLLPRESLGNQGSAS